jgi:hypothetical protein
MPKILLVNRKAFRLIFSNLLCKSLSEIFEKNCWLGSLLKRRFWQSVALPALYLTANGESYDSPHEI